MNNKNLTKPCQSCMVKNKKEQNYSHSFKQTNWTLKCTGVRKCVLLSIKLLSAHLLRSLLKN